MSRPDDEWPARPPADPMGAEPTAAEPMPPTGPTPGEPTPVEPTPVEPTSVEPAPPADATPAGRRSPAPGFDSRGHVKRTRISGVWIGLIGTALFLILLIIFISQNSRAVSIHFLGWHGQFSLALTIILSAVIGILLVAIPGSVRIVQLRRALRRNVPDGKARD